jgi:membrane fusion protein (multidrug efflux system)
MNRCMKKNSLQMKIPSLTLALALVTAAVSLSSCTKKDTTFQVKSSDEVFNVQTTKVATAPMASNLKVTGTLEGIKEATVQSETQGRVLQVVRTIGDRVGAGSPLILVDNEMKSIALQQAVAARMAAEASLEKAKIDQGRNSELLKESAGTKNQVELSDLQVKSAQAQLKGMQSAEKLARRQLADATVKAPFSGVIVNRFVNQGESVTSGAKVETLVDDSRMKFKMFINELDISSLKIGDEVTVSVDALGSSTTLGHVTNISNKADQTRSYEVDVEVPNQTHSLKSGMFARAEIQRGQLHDAVSVPTEAVIYSGTATQVYLVSNGLAHLQNVKIGASTAQMVEITDGVKPGDEVVVFGQGTLHDNAKIRK